MKKLLLLSIVFSLISISFVSAIQITSLSELYSNDTLRIFEFTIKNNDSAALDAVNWSLDTKNNNVIKNNQNINLSVNENISVFVKYNYTTRGIFNITVNASNGTLTDTENLLVTVSDIVITDFSYLYLDQTNFIFEFLINNSGTTTLTDINWSLNMGNGNIINSNILFNLTAGENIRIYTNYNYSVGEYNVIANAYDNLNNHSTTLSVKTNTTPVISPLPDVTFKEDNYSDAIVLDNYVSDEDSDAELTWTVSGNSSDTVRVKILPDHRVNFTSALNYYNDPNGINITFTVVDMDGLTSNDTTLVIVEKLNDPPNITWHSPENLKVFVATNGEQLFNHTSEDIDNPTLYYNWSLDGLTQSISQSWLYQPTMSDAGNHIVNLTVKDNLGGIDSIQWNVTVYITYCNNHYNISIGDWTVNSNITCQNETIPLKANLIVQNNGNLTFRNITLQINSTVGGQYGITVQSGGKVYITDRDDNKLTTNDRSVIERGEGGAAYNLIVNGGAVFEMRNSKLAGAGFNANPNNRGPWNQCK